MDVAADCGQELGFVSWGPGLRLDEMRVAKSREVVVVDDVTEFADELKCVFLCRQRVVSSNE